MAVVLLAGCATHAPTHASEARSHDPEARIEQLTARNAELSALLDQVRALRIQRRMPHRFASPTDQRFRCAGSVLEVDDTLVVLRLAAPPLGNGRESPVSMGFQRRLVDVVDVAHDGMIGELVIDDVQRMPDHIAVSGSFLGVRPLEVEEMVAIEWDLPGLGSIVALSFPPPEARIRAVADGRLFVEVERVPGASFGLDQAALWAAFDDEGYKGDVWVYRVREIDGSRWLTGVATGSIAGHELVPGDRLTLVETTPGVSFVPELTHRLELIALAAIAGRVTEVADDHLVLEITDNPLGVEARELHRARLEVYDEEGVKHRATVADASAFASRRELRCTLSDKPASERNIAAGDAARVARPQQPR